MSTFLHISNIIVPANRQRQLFSRKEIVDLKASILSKGLMQPVVVREDGVTLVAGERRLRAMTELYMDGEAFSHNGVQVTINFVPVTLLGNLDPLDIREAELEENTIRVDITWQERAAAISELHELRMARSPVHKTSDTIKEVAKSSEGSRATSVRDSLILAEHLSNPEVAKAKSQKDAIKIVRKIKEAEHRQVLAANFDMTKTTHDVRLGSMLDLMPTLPSNTFDLILTDPPYGMGADTFGDMASTGHNYEDTWENAQKLYIALAEEGYRVAKSEAHLYAFCNFEHFDEVSGILMLAGWNVWTRPIIWDKCGGMLPRPDYGPRYTYECICFANKGSKKTLRVGADIIRVSGDTGLLHGAQKPVDLYVDLITRSCLPGSEVLDPFGGSGTVLSACSKTRCKATMFELIPANYDIAVSRLNEAASLDDISLEGFA